MSSVTSIPYWLPTVRGTSITATLWRWSGPDITTSLPTPPGGRLGRNPDTGRLDGVIYERAADDLRENQLPVESTDTRREGLRVICEMLNRAGLTSVHDARVTDYELRTYQEGRDAGDLTLRVYALMWHRYFPALRDAGIVAGFGDDQLRIGGIKMVADGAIASRTAYLSEPYVGSCCDHGILTMTEDEIAGNVMEMHAAGLPGLHPRQRRLHH